MIVFFDYLTLEHSANARSQFRLKKILKKHVMRKTNTPPIYYYHAGNRQGQVLRALLRMHCASLSEHLYARNLVDSPLCSCGQTETTTHFLLYCNRYINLSVPFPVVLDVNVLLFGPKNLSDEQNKYLFLQVHKYIIDSKRFT